MNNKWSTIEKQFIRDNAATMKDIEIAQKLTECSHRLVTLEAVRKQRQKMGLTKVCGRGYCELKKNEPTNRL